MNPVVEKTSSGRHLYHPVKGGAVRIEFPRTHTAGGTDKQRSEDIRPSVVEMMGPSRELDGCDAEDASHNVGTSDKEDDDVSDVSGEMREVVVQ